MKKKFTGIFTAIICVVALAFSLVGCDVNKTGEVKFTGLSEQSDILVELRSKTSDIGIMDSIMAENYVSQEVNKNLMIIKDLRLTEEKYGIAFRKDSVGFADKVNTALTELSKDGTMLTIATKYKVSNEVIDFDYTSKWDTLTAEEKADFEAVKATGKMILGYTEFEPIAYTENGKLIGYDIEIAQKVCEKLGLELVTHEIRWELKIPELNAKNIDCIWNGMTITDEIQTGCEVSVPYLNNAQVALIRVADKDKYTKDILSFAGANISAESGSAGEIAFEKIIKPLLYK